MAEAATPSPGYEALPQRDRFRKGRPTKRTRTESTGLADDVPAVEVAAITPPDGGAQQGAEPAGVDNTAGTSGRGELQLPAFRSAAEDGYTFEYLDHTADVQIHAWGTTLEDAFAAAALGMYNYMTPLQQLEGEEVEREFSATGHDLQSLLFAFLDELLFVFHTEMLVCRQVALRRIDREGWRVQAHGRGVRFDRSLHACGTEIKAITYSAMQIREQQGDAELFVIVDI